MVEINTLSGLDSLLDGKPQGTPAATTDPAPAVIEQPAQADPTVTDPAVIDPATNTNGGDPNLKPGQTTDPASTVPGESETQVPAKNDAAFAKLRIEATESNRVIMELAKALDLDVKDPVAARQMLLNMSSQKLAEKAQLPVDVYNELNSTKDQLAQIQYQQRQVSVRESLLDIKTRYNLDDKEILNFANTLDAEGVNPLIDPSVNLDYEFYKRNAQALEKKRIDKAVEEALRKNNTAEQHSSTPSKAQGGTPPAPASGKINTVAGLNDLLKD